MATTSISGVELAVAAKAVTELAANGAPLPVATVEAVKASGFEPHSKWATRVALGALRELSTSDLPTTATRKEFVKDTSTLMAGEEVSRAELARWLVEVGDPAWAELEKQKAGNAAEAIVAARAALAASVVEGTVAAAVAAATSAKEHHKANVATYKDEDDELSARWAEDDTPDDVKVEERRRVDERRARARLTAMWGTP